MTARPWVALSRWTTRLIIALLVLTSWYQPDHPSATPTPSSTSTTRFGPGPAPTATWQSARTTPATTAGSAHPSTPAATRVAGTTSPASPRPSPHPTLTPSWHWRSPPIVPFRTTRAPTRRSAEPARTLDRVPASGSDPRAGLDTQPQASSTTGDAVVSASTSGPITPLNVTIGRRLVIGGTILLLISLTGLVLVGLHRRRW